MLSPSLPRCYRQLQGALGSKRCMSSISVISTASQSYVQHLVINRPPANALSKDFVRELRMAVAKVQEDTSVRAVVMRSELPRVFCAGADLKERISMTDEETKAFSRLLRETMDMVAGIKVPVISAVEGAALGGGLELMLASDIRVAGKGAVMGLIETSLGILPGAGGTQRLPRIIGEARAKELIFTAKKFSAEEAVHLGIVNYCVEAGQAVAKAEELADRIADMGPMGIHYAKKAIDQGLQVSLKEGMAVEEENYNKTVGTKDRLEGLRAFRDKRPAVYKGA
ncbi:unnamed protein product [Chrysoparadoxa australica]